MIIVTGAFSLFTLAVAMLVLSGLISPTLNLTALTMLAIGFTSAGAMTGLVETMIKTSGLVKPSPGGQNPAEEELG